MNILERLWFRATTGADIRVANHGKPIDQITIRYKDFYFFVDIDDETQEPTGGFGWSKDPTMNPSVPIRKIWTANPPSSGLNLGGSDE